MLKALKNLNGAHPRSEFKGWKYPGDVTYEFNDSYASVTDLYRHVREFEAANKLPQIPALEEVLEDYFCRTCPYYGQFCVEDVVEEVGVTDKVKRVLAGGKAILNIKVKAFTQRLRLLSLPEVQANVNQCAGCDMNRGVLAEVGHEGVYVGDIEACHGKSIKELERKNHEKIGRCYGCGCKIGTKVFLHVEDYGEALLENYHDINRLIHARTGGGEVCWQIRALFHPEHLEAILKKGSVNKKMLKDWGYIS